MSTTKHAMVTVRMPFEGGLARDVAENTFHFIYPGEDISANYEGFRTRLEDFYNTEAVATSVAVTDFIGPMVNRSEVTIGYADIVTATGIYDGETVWEPFDLDAAEGTPGQWPSEVALCMTFGGTSTPPLPVAQRRGRIYIGPLGDNGDTLDPNGNNRPTGTIRNTIAEAGTRLADSGGAGLDWMVYSRVARSLTLVRGGWIDDAWDTQRRRGMDPTARTTWTITEP